MYLAVKYIYYLCPFIYLAIKHNYYLCLSWLISLDELSVVKNTVKSV